MNSNGLSTREALRKLKRIISQQTACCFDHKTSYYVLLKRMFSTSHFSWIGAVGLLFVVVALIVNLAWFQSYSSGSLICELVLLVTLITVELVFGLRETYLKDKEIENSINNLSQQINENDNWTDAQYAELDDKTSTTSTLVWTMRDHHFVNLPWNLLVDGDVIVLGAGEMAPANCKEVKSVSCSHSSHPLFSLEAGDIFNPAVISDEGVDSPCKPLPRQMFQVTQAPIEIIMSSYLHQNHCKKESIYSIDAKIIHKFIEHKLLPVVLLLMIIINVLRWKFTASGSLLEMLFLLPAYTILPLLPTTFPLLWTTVAFYGAVKIKSIFQLNEERFGVLKGLLRILSGDSEGLPRNINLLHGLGSITTFNCIDKEGILCYPQPIPEKLFVFNNRQQQEQNGEQPQDQLSPSNSNGAGMNDVEIMGISPDSKRKNGIQFDDVEWQNSIMNLKPLGLNMLINAACNNPMKATRENDFINQLSLQTNNHASIGLNGCLCNLAKEIGFEEALFDRYNIQQKFLAFNHIDTSCEENTSSNFYLSIVREKHVPHMSSTIVKQQNNNAYQLFSVGSADIILEACSHLWDGSSIGKMTKSKREKALNFFQRTNITGKCLAYAYRPVFQDVKPGADSFVEYMKPVKPLIDISPKKENKAKTSVQQLYNDLQVEELVETFTSDKQDTKNLDEQIFLGMVTLRHHLIEDVVELVEKLNGGGIRFVNFSYDNELLSRVFCQRLGLETGWNCHISLGEREYGECSSSAISDSCPFLSQEQEQTNRVVKREGSESIDVALEVDDSQSYGNFDELYFMSNRSKLPKGISCMRSHLEEVDDVPLLVPLFTDCTPQAICEMTCIMQDYDDVVCSVGSSINSKNFLIFKTSNISISVDPVFRSACSTRLHKNNNKSDPDIWNANKETGPMRLSAMLNSISCSVRCSRSHNFPMVQALSEARRMLLGLRSCFLFLVSCHVSLTLLHTLSSCLLLPPPLQGSHMLWLVCVVVPLLSLPLIATPTHPMSIITGKRKKHHYKDFAASFVKNFVLMFGVNSVVIATCLYPWLLNMFCQQDHCHWLLQNRNDTSRWRGLYYRSDLGFHVTQNFLLAYITFSFAAFSSTFVNRYELLWNQSPFNNKMWMISVVICVLLQLLFSCISLHSTNIIHKVSPYFYLVAFLFIGVILVISEICKRSFIKAFARFQKRERLKFDTKLGMNSPI